MSTLVLPDARLEMPALLYPKRKPVGKVKIDWEHPLARGLVGCYGVNNSYNNLVDNESPSAIHASSLLRGDLNLDDGASAPYLEYSADTHKDYADMSVLVGTKISFEQQYSQILGKRVDGEYSYSMRGNNGIYQVLFSGGSVGSGAMSTDGSYHEYAFTHKGISSEAKLYVDGSLTDTATKSRIANTVPFRLGNYESNTMRQIMRFAFIWDRILSGDELKLLNDNPYQFLEPE